MRKPDNSSKPVAKSLHTVTVLYQVARLIGYEAGGLTVAQSLDHAMTVLELAGRPDPYGLRARALGLLLADRPAAAGELNREAENAR